MNNQQRISFWTSIALSVLISGCATYPIEYIFSPVEKEYSPPKLDGMSAVTGEVKLPYNHICRINTLRSYAGIFSKTYTGSAALLANGILVTAAHNFYKPFYPSQVIKYHAKCGGGIKEGPENFSYDSKSKREVIFKHPTEFQYHDYPIDFALVTTCQSTESPFRLPKHVDEVRELLKGPVVTAGFPAESNKKIQGIALNGGQMFHALIKIDESDLEGETIRYSHLGLDIDTYGGQSGSPLWVESGDGYVIVGVHVAEATATIFNQDKIDWLKKHIVLLNNQCSVE